MTKTTLILTFLLLCAPFSSLAQDPTGVCLAMVTAAAHNVNLATSSSQYLYTLFDDYCKSDGSTKQSSWNAGLSAVVQSIPVSLTGGATDAGTAFSNFCRNYASTAAGSSSSFSMESNVVEKALESANQCLTIASRGSYVTYRIMTPKTLAINFNIGAGNPLNIRGVSHDASVNCEGSRANGTGVIRYSTGVGQSLSSDLGSYSITCTRSPSPQSDGNLQYAETSVVLDTNAGGFDVYWPRESVLPLRDASAIEASVDSLKQQLVSTTTVIQRLQAAVSSIGNGDDQQPQQFGEGSAARGPQRVACPKGQFVSAVTVTRWNSDHDDASVDNLSIACRQASLSQ